MGGSKRAALAAKNGTANGAIAVLRDEDGEAATVSRAVARAKQGDRDAMRYLYVRFSDMVCRYVRGIVRDDHEAEDVTQQVFAKLITVIGKYEERAVPFSAWILRVARNAAVDHIRVRSPIPCEEVRGADGRVEMPGNTQTSVLTDALASLPKEQREVLVLRHLVGMSPGEIADRLGKSEGSIHGLHHRGRRAVRERLVEMDSAPSVAESR